MKKSIIYFLFALFFSASLSTFTSCRERTPGEKVEDGIEEVGDGIEESAEDAGDAIEDAVDDN